MQGAYKRFDQALYNETDTAACDRVIAFLTSKGLYAIRNDDKYGPDIVVFRGFKPHYYVEVEVKRVWKAGQDQFPWTTVQLPERKEKFLKAGLPLDFWILREDMETAMILPDHIVAVSPKVEVSNKYLSSQELFFQVDVTECIQLDIRKDSSFQE